MNFVLDPSLVLYLPLWKRDGSSFMSDDAYGHTCTVTTASWGVQGRTFVGTGYLTVPSNAAFNFTASAFTIESWVKITNLVLDQRTVVSKPTSYWDAFRADPANAYWFSTHDGAAEHTSKMADNSSVINTWYHQVVTRIGANATPYVNGRLVSWNLAGDHTTIVTNANNLQIGALGTASQKFHGIIGEVRIYNRALTPLEIQHNFLSTKWRYK